MDLNRVDEPILSAHQLAADTVHSFDERISPWLMGGWCLQLTALGYVSAIVMALALTKEPPPVWAYAVSTLIGLLVGTILHFQARGVFRRHLAWRAGKQVLPRREAVYVRRWYLVMAIFFLLQYLLSPSVEVPTFVAWLFAYSLFAAAAGYYFDSCQQPTPMDFGFQPQAT